MSEETTIAPIVAEDAAPVAFINNGLPCWNCGLFQHDLSVELCARCNVKLRPLGWKPDAPEAEPQLVEEGGAVSRETAGEANPVETAPAADADAKTVKPKKADAPSA